MVQVGEGIQDDFWEPGAAAAAAVSAYAYADLETGCDMSNVTSDTWKYPLNTTNGQHYNISNNSNNNINSSNWNHLSSLSCDLRFRKILPRDRQRIQELHEEWFPVSYQSEFFDDLVYGKMCHTGEDLYTNVAATTPPPPGNLQQPEPHKTANGQANHQSHDDYPHKFMSDNVVDDEIVACIVAALIPSTKLNSVSRQLLVPNHLRHSQVCYIMTLGTVPEYRKCGLATTLVEQCVQDLITDDPNCGALYLHVSTSNDSAIRFYERLGFWRVQEIPDYYTIQGTLHNSYLYAKYFHGKPLVFAMLCLHITYPQASFCLALSRKSWSFRLVSNCFLVDLFYMGTFQGTIDVFGYTSTVGHNLEMWNTIFWLP